MLILDFVRLCEVGSGAVGGGPTSTPASLKVEFVSGDAAGDSTNLAEDLLDQVLKWAGGGREPVGRVGRLVRSSCR
jgi:hypothetical protein